MRRTLMSRLVVLAAMVLAMVVFASPAWARTFTVDRTDDITPPSGVGTCSPTGAFDCTLRGAIQVSNTNGETDTIEFGTAVREDGEILLTEPLTVANDTPADHGLTINGPGQDVLTVRQSPNVQLRVFQIIGKTTINGITISGGEPLGDGGGILNNSGAVLTLNDTTVATNRAFDTQTDTGDGGGIYNFDGTLTLNDSTVSLNTAAYYGGGIYSETDLPPGPSKTTVTNSTISGNYAFNGGGGIYNYTGLTAIEYSTITDNTASSGGLGNGVASFGNTAITRTEVRSSIVSANLGTDVDFVSGTGTNTFVSKGYNLIGDGNATDAFNNTGDRAGVNIPGLEPLANNGGPTQTHALLSSSPAIDRGTNTDCPATCPTTDQRGVTRPQGTTSDIGAFEVDRAPRVVSVTPANLARNVAPNVTATFSEAMNPSTLNRTTFKLVRRGTTTPVSAEVSYSAATKRATLNPKRSLVAGAIYTATVTTGAKDLAGKALAANKVWSFTVRT